MSPVLDASAVLAYLHQEPGWGDVQAVIGEGCISAVNWSEVAQKTRQNGLNAEVTRELLAEVGLNIVPFSTSQAEIAARLSEATPRRERSLADRTCLALAMERAAPVLTGDRSWAELGLGVEIRVLRRG